jgi:hypothetical protein
MTVTLPRPPGVLEPRVDEIFSELGQAAIALEWRIADNPQGGGPVASFERLWGWAESGKWVPGSEFVEVINQDIEVFGGQFAGRRVGEQAPAVTLRALPKLRWEVESDDAELVKSLRVAYPKAISLPKGGFSIPHGSTNMRLQRERARAPALEEGAGKPRRDNLDELMGDGPAEEELD